MIVVRFEELQYVAASHEDPRDPGVLKKVLASKAELTVGRIQMLNWSLLKSGRSFQRHFHEDMQEVFVVVDGSATMKVESDSGEVHTVELHRGDAIIIEAREVHSMKNHTASDTFYLVFGISAETDGQTVVLDS